MNDTQPTRAMCNIAQPGCNRGVSIVRRFLRYDRSIERARRPLVSAEEWTRVRRACVSRQDMTTCHLPVSIGDATCSKR